MYRLATSVLMGALSLFAQGAHSAKTKQESIELWAAITVLEPIFSEGQTQNLQLEFGLVNESRTMAYPNVESSHLFINGAQPQDGPFGVVIRNGFGPRTSDFAALPPGHSLRFGYAMGKYFEKPGIYTVRWEGEHFRAPDLIFRVMPKGR
jgi:hypothetical protein